MRSAFFGSLDATRVAQGDPGDVLEVVHFVLAVVERDDETPFSSELAQNCSD